MKLEKILLEKVTRLFTRQPGLSGYGLRVASMLLVSLGVLMVLLPIYGSALYWVAVAIFAEPPSVPYGFALISTVVGLLSIRAGCGLSPEWGIPSGVLLILCAGLYLCLMLQAPIEFARLTNGLALAFLAVGIVMLVRNRRRILAAATQEDWMRRLDGWPEAEMAFAGFSNSRFEQEAVFGVSERIESPSFDQATAVMAADDTDARENRIQGGGWFETDLEALSDQVSIGRGPSPLAADETEELETVSSDKWRRNVA